MRDGQLAPRYCSAVLETQKTDISVHNPAKEPVEHVFLTLPTHGVNYLFKDNERFCRKNPFACVVGVYVRYVMQRL